MGQDTRGRLIGRVKPEDVLNYVRDHYDQNAGINIISCDYGKVADKNYIKEVYDDSGLWKCTNGFIDFEYAGDKYSMFYCYENINAYENLDYYEPLGLECMVKQETTKLVLPYWKNSVKIMKNIVGCFGGWVDDNDCDDVPYYPVSEKSLAHVSDKFKYKDNDIIVRRGNHLSARAEIAQHTKCTCCGKEIGNEEYVMLMSNYRCFPNTKVHAACFDKEDPVKICERIERMYLKYNELNSYFI